MFGNRWAPVVSATLLVLASACAAPEQSTFLAPDAIGELLQERVDRGQNAGIVVGLLEPDGSQIDYDPRVLPPIHALLQ